MEFQRVGRVNIVLHLIGAAILKILGWTAEGRPPDAPKYVAIVAPHTSNWDYPIALMVSWKFRMKGAWLGKSQIFTWPLLSWFFRKTGGIPVDRTRHQGLVGQAVHVFKERDALVLAIAPEGTRSKVDYWKSGFYHIALEANVPLALGYLDFKRKAVGFGPLYQPTGDVDADLAFISDFYDTITPRHPDRRSAVRFRQSLSKKAESEAHAPSFPDAVGMH